MALHRRDAIRTSSKRLSSWLLGAHMLAFVPAIALSAFWIAGEHALVMVALGLPILYLLTGTLNEAHAAKTREVDATTGLPMIDQLEIDAEEMIISCSEAGRKSALFFIQLEEFEALHGEIIRSMMVDRFQHLDTDGDGLVTAGEMTAPADRMGMRPPIQGMMGDNMGTQDN